MQTRIAERGEEEASAKEYAAKGIMIDTPISDALDVFEELDHNHSRIERKKCYVWKDTASVNKEEWPRA